MCYVQVQGCRKVWFPPMRTDMQLDMLIMFIVSWALELCNM